MRPVIVLLACLSVLASCTYRFVGRENYSSSDLPFDGKGLSFSFETTVLRIAEIDSGEIATKRLFADLMLEYNDRTIGSTCCQTAAVYVNGIPTGSTRQVKTQSYSDFNVLSNLKIHPLGFVSKRALQWSPYLIAGVGFHKYYFQNYILGSGSSGSFYDEEKKLSSGIYQHAGIGMRFSPTKTAGFLSLNLEYRRDIGKSHQGINLNTSVFSVGLTIFEMFTHL